jgi:hypothetical protein
MTWQEEAARGARIPVVIVEVDLDYVTDVAGGPILAVNSDGSFCYSTPSTMGTQIIVTTGIKTRRWMTSTQKAIPLTLDAIPCLKSASILAEEIRIGRGLGFFGKVSLALIDFVDDDRRTEDPFANDVSRIGTNPEDGSYFGKLFARNPYWTNRPIRVIEGFTTDGAFDPSDAIVHNFFVRDVQGPVDGNFTINAVGPLQLLNLEESEAPKASDGVLAADITDVATSATIADPVFAATYPTSGSLRIGDEVCTYTRSGQALTLTRAQKGTKAETHGEGDSIQQVLTYSATPIVDIIEDLLTTYGGVDPSNLALAEWATEQSSWLSDYVLTADVSQPTKILDLLQELLEVAVCVFWWDDRTGQLRLRAVRPAFNAIDTWGDKSHLLKRPQIRRDMGERVSRTDVLVQLRTAASDPKSSSSYRFRLIGDEQGAGVGKHGSSKLKLVPSRWLSDSTISLGARVSAQVTAQLRDGRQTYVVEVSAKDGHREIGDVIDLQSRDIVGTKGQQVTVRCIVTKREVVKNGSTYRYTLEKSGIGGRFAFFTDDPYPDYSTATAIERDPGAFWADVDGTGLDGDPFYSFA